MSFGAATVVSSILLLFAVGVGIGLRLLIGDLVAKPPGAVVLWSAELALAAVLGAAVGLTAIYVFAVVGLISALRVGLIAYAATAGVLAVRGAPSRHPRALLSGLGHFFGASGASTVGALVAVALSKSF